MKPRTLLLALGLIFLAGCASVPKRNPLPEDKIARSELVGLPGVRIPVDPFQTDWSDLDRSLLSPHTGETGRKGKPIVLLALSGGGAHGAWGAGIMGGWTASGNRPVFDLVTGVSTGALGATYAFLGSDYDEDLKQSYTTMSDDDIYRTRNIFGILKHNDALADSSPLLDQLKNRFGPEILKAVAAEHRKGRRLYVGSTNLDAQTMMVWDMGAIAASDHPQAVDVFCRVLLASASVPVAFPPVSFKVEADGVVYDEIHADGGVIAQVFGFGLLYRLMEVDGGSSGEMYVLRNTYMTPDWVAVEPSIVSLAGRSIGTLTKTQGLGDVFRAWAVAEYTGIDFNLCDIPESVHPAQSDQQFDPVYMTKLYEAGYEAGKSGQIWKKKPPGIELLEDLHTDRQAKAK